MRRLIGRLRGDAGMNTAEYAVVVLRIRCQVEFKPRIGMIGTME